MKKLLLSSLIIFSIFLLSSCTKDEKIHLEKEYYNDAKFIEISDTDIKTMDDKNYLLFVYNNYCQFKVPCDEIFQEFIEKYNISILKMPYEEFKNTYLHDKILYAPSVIIINKGNIISYLDAEKDEDKIKYQSVDEFAKWLEKYIYMEQK